MEILSNLKEKLAKNENLVFILGIFLLAFFFLFYGSGDYRLIDVDETRYVNIAREMFRTGDYITPVLNFEPFLEKPPLFYWLTCLSYKIFNNTGEFASRFPIGIMALICIFTVYFFVKNIAKSALAGFLSAVILMSSFWYGLFNRIAMLDSTFTALCTMAFCSGVSTLFVDKEIIKKLLWYSGYFFLALAVLQKGLIGIIVPGVSLLAVFLVLKRAKEIIKPSYITVGILIFLLVSVPWHYLVYKANGDVWFNEYILKHHLARFADSSMSIGRKQPAFFYIPVILAGFLPWGIFLIYGAVELFKKIKNTAFKELINPKDNFHTLILISTVWLSVIFVFFSLSSTKLPTYILPAFPPASILLGVMFFEFLKNDKFKKGMNLTALLTFIAFFITSIGLFIVLIMKIAGLEMLNIPVCFLVFAIIGFFAYKKSEKVAMFNLIMSFGLIVTGINAHFLLNFATSFVQPEVEKFAQIANEDDNPLLVSYKASRKYSMLSYYNKNKILFFCDETVVNNANIIKLFDEAKKNNQTIYVIVRIKRYEDFKPIEDFFERVKTGKHAILYKKIPS